MIQVLRLIAYPIVATVLILAAARPAAAQRLLGQAVSVHAYLGAIDLQKLYTFADDTETDQFGGMLMGGQAGFGITPSISVLGNYALLSTTSYLKRASENSFGDAFAFDVTMWDVNLQVRKPFWHERMLNPLLQLGAGQMILRTAPGSDPDNLEEQVVATFNAGLGIDLQISNAFGFRAMVKDYYTTATWSNSLNPRFNAEAMTTPSHNLAYHIGVTLGF